MNDSDGEAGLGIQKLCEQLMHCEFFTVVVERSLVCSASSEVEQAVI